MDVLDLVNWILCGALVWVVVMLAQWDSRLWPGACDPETEYWKRKRAIAHADVKSLRRTLEVLESRRSCADPGTDYSRLLDVQIAEIRVALKTKERK